MISFTALYDACVLYPAPLRDFLMQLAITDLFRARWTDRILDEWMASLMKDRPDLDANRLERTRRLMNEGTLDSVITGYEPLMEGLVLPDENDRHVLAAAIHGRADVIITFNLKDFPSEILETFGVEAQHPDEFIRHLFDLSPSIVCLAAKKCRARLKNPPKSIEHYLESLERQQLVETVRQLRSYKELI